MCEQFLFQTYLWIDVRAYSTPNAGLLLFTGASSVFRVLSHRQIFPTYDKEMDAEVSAIPDTKKNRLGRFVAQNTFDEVSKAIEHLARNLQRRKTLCLSDPF
jgi:hypothetical protein